MNIGSKSKDPQSKIMTKARSWTQISKYMGKSILPFEALKEKEEGG